MTRFDATTPEDRRELVADAVVAHRERGSQFCTIEADRPPASERTDTDADDAGDTNPDEDTEDDAPDPTPAWIQYSVPEHQLNLDCTDDEYDRITTLLADFPQFTVADQTAPDDADGRNLRIETYADEERIAAFVERCFLAGFDYEEDDLRLWVTEL